MAIFSSKKAGIVLALSLLVFASCQKDIDVQAAKGGGNTTPPPSNLSPQAALGKLLYQDKNLSMDDNYTYVDRTPVKIQSCQSCHAPDQGFAGMSSYDGLGSFRDSENDPYLRKFTAGFAEGATQGRFGGRIPPTAAYAAFAPVLQTKTVTLLNNGNADVEFFGGLFWDGRATGLRLNNPAAEQALGPFLSTVEMNVHSAIEQTTVGGRREVLQRVKDRTDYYGNAWAAAWGSMPADLSIASDAVINDLYDKIGLSIAAFEGSIEVVPFTSKYDQYVATKAGLTTQELAGLTLFSNNINNATKGKRGAGCFNCHAINNTFNNKQVFTDFGYDNIGLPSATEHPDGPINTVDGGLGAFLQTLPASNPWSNIDFVTKNWGAFKTPTLRNTGKNEGNRRFMHNGVFKSLDEVVHFYNTRDLAGIDPKAGWPLDANGNTIPGVTKPWGKPEYAPTMKTGGEVGNLKLTWTEEKQLVAFMRALTDGQWVR